MVVRFEQLLLLDNNDNIGKAGAMIQDTQSAEPRSDHSVDISVSVVAPAYKF